MELKRIDYPVASSKYFIDGTSVSKDKYSNSHWGMTLSNFLTKSRQGNNGIVYTHTMTAT